jgi:hypothetical protein
VDQGNPGDRQPIKASIPVFDWDQEFPQWGVLQYHDAKWRKFDV